MLRQRDVRPDVGTGAAVVVAAAAAATATSAVLMASGRTPALLLLVTCGVLVLLGGQVSRWPLALAGSVLCLLTYVSVVMLAMPLLGTSLVGGDTAALALVSFLACGWMWRRRTTLLLPSRSGSLLAGASLVVPALALLTTLIIELRNHGDKVAWAMANDSTFNLMTGRFLVQDGGLNLHAHPNVAPLTAELVALFIAPGRSGLSAQDLLRHDVQRTISLLLLLLALMSVLSSVLVAHLVPRRHPVARSLLAVAAGVLPWSWVVGGYSVQYGFWNAIVTGVALVATWIVWVEVPAAPLRASALLAVSATTLLTVWVPLVLVPCAFGLAVVLRHWRSHLAMRRWHLATWLLPVLIFLFFAYLLVRPVTVPDSSGNRPVSSLSADGAFFAFGHSVPGTVAMLALAVALTGACITGVRWELFGVVLAVAVGWVGLHYLMGQRAANPTGAWGYYPQKFSWLLCVLAPLVAARSLAALLRLRRVSAMRGIGVAGAAALVAAVMLAQIPPADSRPATSKGNPAPRLAPDYRATSMFFLLSLAGEHGASDLDPAASVLFDWSSPQRKVVTAGWFSDPSLDAFVNFWLLQQAYTTGHPDVRSFAYTLNPGDAEQLCLVVRTWDGGVTLQTREPDLERRMRAACPHLRYTVHYVRGGTVPSPR